MTATCQLALLCGHGEVKAHLLMQWDYRTDSGVEIECPGGQLVTEAMTDHIADLLFRIDAGGFAGLVPFVYMDTETKDYWREQAKEFLDALTQRVLAP